MTFVQRPHHCDLINAISTSISTDYPHTRLLLAIAKFSRCEQGVWKAWPSISTLRDLCGYKDDRNVRVVLAQLEKFGLISIYRRHKASNLYTLHPSQISLFDPVKLKLRKIKDRATSGLKALISAAKQFLQRKQQLTKDGVYLDHDEADRVATAEAKAIASKAKFGQNGAKRPPATQYSGPSRQALQMIFNSITYQLDEAMQAGNEGEIARLNIAKQEAEADLAAYRG